MATTVMSGMGQMQRASPKGTTTMDSLSKQHQNITKTKSQRVSLQSDVSISQCRSRKSCTSLLDVLQSFNVPFSEDQVWAIVHQFVALYRNCILATAQNQSKDDDSTVDQNANTSDSEDIEASDKNDDDLSIGCRKSVIEMDQVDYQSVPALMQNFRIHRDGSVHVSYEEEGNCEHCKIF